MVRRLAGSSHSVEVLDMTRVDVAARARQLGIHSVPSVVIDGKLATCCAGRGPEEVTLLTEIAGRSRSATLRAELSYRLDLLGLKWTLLDTKLANIMLTQNLSLSQLMRMSDEELLELRHFGQGCLQRLRVIGWSDHQKDGNRLAL
jgi:hypothetical protein